MITCKALELLIPQASPFELVRVGGAADGAYLIPNDLEGIDACFSPGVNNFKHFEDELTNRNGIKCHMCDFTSDPEYFSTPLVEGMQTFKKKWLDIDGSEDSILLKDWIHEFSPDNRKDLILQIDIEGSEYRNLLTADQNTLNRFRIIVIELHLLEALEKPELLSKEVVPLLEKLHDTHKPVHAHPNNCNGDFVESGSGLNVPYYLEMTYLRRDRFTGDESRYIQPQLPHPLDINCNVRSNPPIHLNEKWIHSGKRSLDSEIKVLRDNLDYATREINRLKSASDDFHDMIMFHTLLTTNSPGNRPSNCKFDYDLNELDFLAKTNSNLALGKKYILSQPHESFPSDGIVKEDSRFFFHTAVGTNQSITIDLDNDHKLNYLVICNRKDECQDRARILFCVIHKTKEYSFKDAFPVAVNEEFLRSGEQQSITPLFGKAGRFLTIFSPIHTALHFSSICIY